MSKNFHIQFSTIKDKAFRFAKKMLNNHEDAQDAVQDLFEKLWKMRLELERYDNIEAFSIRAIRNMCLDKLKHEKVKTQKLKVVSHNQAKSVEDNYETLDLSNQVKSMIQALPEKQKMVLHLRDVEEMEFDEIAQALQMDIQAVRMNLSRGRKTIKTQLIKTMNYGLQ